MIDIVEAANAHSDLRRSRSRWTFPELELVHVDWSTLTSEEGAVRTLLRDACGKPGWLRFPSEALWTHSLSGDRLPPPLPLAGEWCDGSGRSWRVVRDADGSPAVRAYVEGEGDAYLRLDEQVLGRSLKRQSPPKRFLAYAVYWSFDQEDRAYRAFDRFLGFADRRQNENVRR